jgi:hypothetical protein
MPTKIRRSAGSYTPLEALLSRMGLMRREPARDVAAFHEGHTLKILCLTWTIGETRVRSIRGTEMLVAKGGWLFLTKGGDLVWRSVGGAESVTIPALAEVKPSDRKVHLRNQTALTLVTAIGEHDIAIRTVDAHLLPLALGRGPE